MKGVKHYTEDGKEWKGESHKMDDGKMHTGKAHDKSSKALVHKKDLPKSALKVNERLVSQSSETFKYSGGAGSTMSGEFGNLADQKSKEVMSDRMNNEETPEKEDPKTNPKKEKKVKKVKKVKKTKITKNNEPNKQIMDPETMDLITNPDWVLWNELYGKSGPPMKGSPMQRRSPVKHPIPDKTLKDRSKVTHRHDEKGKSHWVDENGKDIPKDILKDLAGGGIDKSPFRSSSSLKSRTREKYLPNSSSSPVKQSEAKMETTLPEVNIWSTFKDLPEEDLKEMVKDHVDNTSYETGDELIKVLQNPKHKLVVKNYLNGVKENIVNAVKDGQTDIKNDWMENVKNLVGNLGMMGQKYSTWSDINKVNPYENNTLGSAISKSSHKGDMRKYDLTYLGSDKINMSIAEEGDIYFKVDGMNDDIWTVKDLDKNVRLKNFQGYKVWDGFIQDIKKTALEGGKVSNTALEGIVNSLTESKDSTLSFFFDFGLFDQFEKQVQEQGGEVNTDTLMPESYNFNMDIVTDLVKNGLINMAKQTMSSAMAARSVSSSSSAASLLRKYSK